MQKETVSALPLPTLRILTVTERIVSVVVIDGNNMGCPCCGQHNCHLPLQNNRQRFCPTHHSQNNKCAIIGCDRELAKRDPNENKTLACDDPEHQKIERVRTQKGQARFVLKERLSRQRVSHPEDAVAQDIAVDELVDADDVIEEFMVESTGRVVSGPDQLDVEGNIVPDNAEHRKGAKPSKKVRAQFGRKRSHNEQIFVAPCGDIITREMFFGAEAVSSVVVSDASGVHKAVHLHGSLGNDHSDLPNQQSHAQPHFL